MPVLKSFNESVESAVVRMTASLREDEDFINKVAQKEFDRLYADGVLSIGEVASLHPAIAKRIIVK